ncbi:MAG: Fic family protein [Anaerolineaceae bacterium]|nr:Fic family protein [Anaerolineaceae bacterium]
MHRFDYSFLDNGLIPAELLNITIDIYSLRERAWTKRDIFENAFVELEKIAKVQSVKSSNEIEGIITTDDRIRAIVQQNSAPRDHNEREIAGYRDALSLIHQEYAVMDFCEDDIRRMHRILFGLTEYDNSGEYKQTNNNIIEEDSSGFRRIRFAPVTAADTPFAMNQLVLAYQDARDNIRVNQLLLIPCVILDFLCIHPFRDGNGRISRLLSLLLLYKKGFDAGKYISFEEQINNRKGNYYDALRHSSVGWHENQNDYSMFIMEFLTTLYLCYKELDRRFAVVGNKVTKQGRIETVVLNSLTPISKAEVCGILPDISPTTIETVLGRMVKNGQVKKIGTGRNTKYLRMME